MGSADGDIAQGGFATSEPYIYKNELGTDQSYEVDLQLINDTGYPMYGQSLAIRPATRTSSRRAWKSWCRSSSRLRSTS